MAGVESRPTADPPHRSHGLKRMRSCHHIRTALAALILGLAASALCHSAHARASSLECRDTFIRRVPSPDGKLAVYLYYRDCIDVSYTTAHMHTAPTATRPDGDEVCYLVTLRGRLKTIEAVWKDDKHVEIRSPDRLAWDLGVSSQQDSCNDVQIAYDLNIEPAPPDFSDDPRVEVAIRTALEQSAPCLASREYPDILQMFYCSLDQCDHRGAVSLLLMHLYDYKCPVSQETFQLLKTAVRALEIDREELEQVRPQVTTARRAAQIIARERQQADEARARIRRRPPGDVSAEPQRLHSVDLDYQTGFIDAAARLVIEPQTLDRRGEFSDGMLMVAGPSELGQNTPYGYLDPAGKLAIPPQFERASDFHEGLAYVEEKMWLDGRIGFIDKAGRLRIPLRRQSDVPRFSEGLAAVGLDTGYGFIDKTGKTVIEPQFTYAGDFHEGLAWVHTRDDKQGYIDQTGKFVIGPGDYDLSDDSNFSEGLAAVRIRRGKFCYIDRTGRVRIPPRFHEAHPFSGGMARVGLNGKDGYIDRTGRLRVAPRYQFASDFSEGLAAVEITGRGYGYIDTTGRLRIGPGFAHADPFTDGMARVYTRERGVGYLDKHGKYVWGPFH